MFLIYTADTWHTYLSKELIGVTDTKGKSIRLCNEKAKEYDTELSEDDIYNLLNINQTQGLNEVDFEFVIEEVEIDTLF